MAGLGVLFLLHLDVGRQLLVAPVQILVLVLAHGLVHTQVWELVPHRFLQRIQVLEFGRVLLESDQGHSCAECWSSDLGNSSIAIAAPVVGLESEYQRRGQVRILTGTYCRFPNVRCVILDECGLMSGVYGSEHKELAPNQFSRRTRDF